MTGAPNDTKSPPQIGDKEQKMDAWETYKLLIGAESAEDQLCLQRLILLGLFNSILLVAFFMAEPTIYFDHIHRALPIIGIIASGGLGITLWVGAKSTMKWIDALCKLEEEPEFAYMKAHKIRPLIDIANVKPGRRHIWKLGYRLSPFAALIFIVMWGICLGVFS